MNIVSNIAARWDAWSQAPNVLRLSSTLLHFVWQGALAAAIALILLAVTRRRSPQARYVALLALFALMTAAPFITWFSLRTEGNRVASLDSVARSQRAQSVDVGPTNPQATTVAFDDIFKPASPAIPPASSANLPRPPDSPVDFPPLPSRFDAAISAVREWLMLYRPWIATAWLIGVSVFGLRLSIGLAGAEITPRRGRVAAPQAVERAVVELSAYLGIRRTVAVFESAMTAVPTLVGWLSPVILLPASAISGLTTEQLEAILAHELAHVRRHDYLVNLLQTLVETLLFYHPAVWWLSGKIRHERELCCDDVALDVCGDRILYARALATLEEKRTDQLRWVMAAGGGVLANRIRRVVGRQQLDGTDRFSLLTVLAALILVLCVIGRVGGPLDAGSQPAGNASHGPAPSPAAKIPPAGLVVDDLRNTTGDGKQSSLISTEAPSISPPSAATLAGRVEDENGTPTAGAHLCWTIWSPSDPPSRICVESHSGVDGRFRIQRPRSLKAETKSLPSALWVLAPGKNLAVIDSREGMVTDGKAREWVVQLKPAKDLTLVVVDPVGQPLRDAIVEPTDYRGPRGGNAAFPDTFQKWLVGTTNADGKVILPELASDRLQGVVVSSTQYGRQRFFLKPIGASPKQTLRLKPAGRVEGRVTAPHGERVGGFVVTLLNLDDSIWSSAKATTDAEGRFAVPAIAEGALTVDLMHDLQAAKPALLPRPPEKVRVVRNQTTTITVPLEETVLVRGSIQTDDTHAPVPSALIAVVYAPNSNSVHVTSDRNGRYEARVLAGRVSNAVLAIPPAFRDLYQDSGQSPGNRDVQVAAGATAELPPIRLAPLRKFQGKIIDRFGRPFTRAELCADSKNRRYGFCKTDEHGEFSTTIPRTIAIEGYEVWVEVHARERTCKVIVEQQETLVLRVTDWPE
jgi:beta-lactamase regulating signal transducer with metallopeptidase domain